MLKLPALKFILVAGMFFATAIAVQAQSEYNILVETDGKTVRKIMKEYLPHSGYTWINFDIICDCYATKRNMKFTFDAFKQKSEILTKLPDSLYTFPKFVELANKRIFVSANFWKKIYLIEKITDTQYIRYQVSFQPFAGEF